MVDFEWYRSFVAIYQTGTVSAAASRRNMTQPTISQHLQVLEQALDTQLFERTPRRMIPTSSGNRLYQEILGAVEKLENAAGRQTDIQPVRIGMKVDFFDEFVIKALAQTGELAYPVQFVFNKPPQLLTMLEREEIEIAVMGEPLNQEQVYYVPVARLPLTMIAPPNTAVPQDVSDEERYEWLSDKQWMCCTPTLDCLRSYWMNVFDRPTEFRNPLALGDCHAVRQAVVHGLGFGIAPIAAVQTDLQAGRLTIPFCPLAPPIYVVYVACLHSRRDNPAFDWFVNLIRNAPLP